MSPIEQIEQNNITTLHYTITQHKKNLLCVTLAIILQKRPHNTSLFLHIPKKTKNIKVLNNAAHIKTTNDDIANITQINSEKILVQYEIENAQDSFSDRKEPIITQKYIHMTGHAFIAYPCPDNIYHFSKKFNVTIKWENFPNNWNFGNQFSIHKNKKSVVTETYATTTYKLVNGIYVAGDFEIKEINCPYDQKVFLAIFDKNFIDNEFIENTVRELINTQVSFFEDKNIGHQCISIVPLKNRGIVTGIQYNGSISIFIGALAIDEITSIAQTISHEIFHIWNGTKIKTNNSDLMLWLSEGFTERYASSFALQTGIITEDEYVNLCANALNRLSRFSPEIRYSPNSNILIPKYTELMKELAYVRGHILAENWDIAIREKTDNICSLNTIILDLYHQSEEDPLFRVSPTTFIKTIKNYVPSMVEKITLDMQRYLDWNIFEESNIPSNKPQEDIPPYNSYKAPKTTNSKELNDLKRTSDEEYQQELEQQRALLDALS
jgi:predicted metalloprotease with PDZ domain